MAESSSKKIEPFKKDLFGSSESSTDLGQGFSAFSSQFSLGPALVSSKEVSASPSKSSLSSQHISPSSGSTPSSYGNSPQSVIKNDSSSADRSSLGNTFIGNTALDGSELSNVPLDTPDPVGETIPSSTLSSDMSKVVLTSVRKEQQGWNDPPSAPSLCMSPSRPPMSKDSSFPASAIKTDDVQIQPFTQTLDCTPTQSHQQHGPPTGSETGTEVAPTNPFRIGVGFGSRKPSYGLSGIASFGSSPSTVPAVPMPTTQEQLTLLHPAMRAGTSVGTPQSFGQVDPSGTPSSNVLTSTSSSTSLTSCEGHPTGSGVNVSYVPVTYHWFYLRPEERYWIPFSLMDSSSLENALLHNQDTLQQVLVPTDGGRYDVDLHSRRRYPVYWEEPVSTVARSSWFHKGNGEKWYRPYDEHIAARLEKEYQYSFHQSSWNRHVDLKDGESVVLLSHTSAIHYSSSSTSSLAQDIDEDRPYTKEVMRGFSDLDRVEAGEQLQVDHLVFIIHGVGMHHDLNFRCLVDCVDDFREVSQLMLKTHKFPHQEVQGVGEELRGSRGGRVEFLPVHWHSKLHSASVDSRLKLLTLPSISRLREFTNSTLLDILYYTSPLFCQTIVTQVASEMNRIFKLFRKRNQSFSGTVSVVGHSLGSVILFDLLCHQPKHAAATAATSAANTTDTATGGPSLSEGASENQEAPLESQTTPSNVGMVEKEGDNGTDGIMTIEEVLTQLGLDNLIQVFQEEQIDFESLLLCSDEDLRELRITMGPRKKLSSYIKQQRAEQEVAQQRQAEAAKAKAQREQLEVVEEKTEEEWNDGEVTRSRYFGVTIVRGLAGTGQTHVEYPRLLFHPQHMFALGSPIGIFLSVRGVEDLGPEFVLPTCPHVFNIFHPFDPVAYRIEPLLVSDAPERPVLIPHHKGRKRFHLELYDNLGTVGASIKQHFVEGLRNMWLQLNEFARSHSSAGPQGMENLDDFNTVLSDTDTNQSSNDSVTSECVLEPDWLAGSINQGRRVDYVLQEKPIEKLNEYLFSISSHVTYWRSEDTALFLLREMYKAPGGHQN